MIHETAHRSSHQQVPRAVTLALDEIVGGWWPEIPKACERCSGRLMVAPPEPGLSGWIYCINCGEQRPEKVETTRVVRPVAGFGDPCAVCGVKRKPYERFRSDCHPMCYQRRYRAERRLDGMVWR